MDKTVHTASILLFDSLTQFPPTKECWNTAKTLKCHQHVKYHFGKEDMPMNKLMTHRTIRAITWPPRLLGSLKEVQGYSQPFWGFEWAPGIQDEGIVETVPMQLTYRVPLMPYLTSNLLRFANEHSAVSITVKPNWFNELGHSIFQHHSWWWSFVS